MIQFSFGWFDAFTLATETEMNIFDFKKSKTKTEPIYFGNGLASFGWFFQFVGFVHTPTFYCMKYVNTI